MSQDSQTYKRSAGASVLGLVLQLSMLVVFGLLSLYAKSSAFAVLTYFLFGGVFIWVTLWVLHTFHKAERVEALEAEQLASNDQAAATIFAEAGDALATARQRLSRMYRFGISIVSGVLALYLIVMGLVQFFSLYGLIKFPENAGQRTDYSALLERAISDETALHAAPMLVALIVFGSLGFLMARYIAGMTKEKHWETLRGGASFLMASVIAIVIVAVGVVFVWAGNRLPLAFAPLAISGMMVLFGVESLFSILMGVYRPKRKGEVPRLPFDSRVMGWLVQPESLGSIVTNTLNYQFGFEVSRSWFYKLIGKALPSMLLATLLVLMGLSSVVIVGPNQRAAVIRLGKLERVVGPGLHVKLPWPLGSAQKVDVLAVQSVATGTMKDPTVEGQGALLWTNVHHGGEVEVNEAGDVVSTSENFMVTAGRSREGEQAAAGSLVGAKLVVLYRIGHTEGNLERYLNSAIEPGRVLQSITERELARFAASHDLEYLLSQGMSEMADTLLPRIRAAAAQANGGQGLGLEILSVSPSSVHPPQDQQVAVNYQERINASIQARIAVERARQEQTRTLTAAAGSVTNAQTIYAMLQEYDVLRETLSNPDTSEEDTQALQAQVDEMRGEIARLIRESGGSAARALEDARSERWVTELTERTAAERFQAEGAAYAAAPAYYATRAYFDALTAAIDGQRIYINATGSELPSTVRLNLESESAGQSILTSPGE